MANWNFSGGADATVVGGTPMAVSLANSFGAGLNNPSLATGSHVAALAAQGATRGNSGGRSV